MIDVEDISTAGCPQSGRRHLDGSLPGEGLYLSRATISLSPGDIKALEEIGQGNRSAAVRLLLKLWRQDATRGAARESARREAGQRPDVRAARRRIGKLQPPSMPTAGRSSESATVRR